MSATRSGPARWLALVLVLLIAVLAFGYLRIGSLAAADARDVRRVLDAGAGGPRAEAAPVEIAGLVVASEEARSAALEAGGEAAAGVLTYGHRTWAADLERAESHLDEVTRREYRETMSALRRATREDRVVVRARVVASAAVVATDRDAKVLVFVDQRTTSRRLDAPRREAVRMILRLHRDGDRWQVTRIDAF